MAKLDQQRASSPEASPAELLQLAYHYPHEVANNPALELIALAQPDFFSQINDIIEANILSRELEEKYALLSDEKKRRFLLVCMERVAPIVDVVFPTNFVQEALQSVRLVLAGLAPQETLATLNVQAKELFEQARQEATAKVSHVPLTTTAQYNAVKAALRALQELTSANLANIEPGQSSSEAEIWHEVASMEPASVAPGQNNLTPIHNRLRHQTTEWQLERLNEISAL